MAAALGDRVLQFSDSTGTLNEFADGNQDRLAAVVVFAESCWAGRHQSFEKGSQFMKFLVKTEAHWVQCSARVGAQTMWLAECTFVLLVCLLVLPKPVLGQTMQGQALAEQEKQWRGCEDGYYTGPRPGRRGFSNDKYLWVVTPEFAKRFCMPEHLIDRDLKGAQAIAFRMVDGADFDRCGVDADGKENCLQDSKARFEIYLAKNLNLPAANPEVRFFDDARTTSDWHIADRERAQRGQAYRAGRYQLPPGKIPRFKNPYDHPDPGHRFALLYAHEGKGRWPVAPLWEVGFRGDWVQGIDMLVLEEQLGMGFHSAQQNAQHNKLSPDVAQPVIVMRKRADMRDSWEMEIPRDFAHVIYLPKPFVENVRRAVSNPGGNWLSFVKTLRQGK